MNFDEAVKLLERRVSVSYSGDKAVRAQCPAHNGDRQSLSVREIDGRLRVKCFAGCDRDEIMAALREIQNPTKPISERQQRELKERARRQVPEVVSEREYVLKDLDGNVVAVHVRMNDKDGNKVGVYWRGGLKGRPLNTLPLYGSEFLRQVDDDEPVYLCEGEKDTEAQWARGCMAVGTVCGAQSTPTDEVLKCLVGRDVIAWPDNDEGGEKHMARILTRLEILNNQQEDEQ